MDYLKLTEYYSQLEGTTKRLEKTEIISHVLKKIKDEKDAEPLINLIRGSVFPPHDERKIGASHRLILKAVAKSTGVEQNKIEKQWAKTGDLGEVVEDLVKKKKQQTLFSKGKLTIKKVYENIRKFAELEGTGTVAKKVDIICNLLAAASPQEAKFIIRTILEDLRVGIGEGTLRDALVWAFFGEKLGIKVDEKTKKLKIPDKQREEYNSISAQVQQAYDLTTDFAEVYKTLKKGGLKSIGKTSLKIGRPLKVMLAIKADDAHEAAETVGLPALCEYKLDGFRVQIHNDGKELKLFTRRLENVTKQFKELVAVIKENVKAKSYVLDAEIIGYNPKTHVYVPFQQISQRIRRKYDIEKLAQKIPVEVDIFDILQKDGEDYTNKSQKERRDTIKNIIKEKKQKIKITEGIYAKTVKEIENFYKKALQEGVEGIMVKNIEKSYTSGRKVGGWLKLKPVLENLDLVITKAETGTGKRGGVLSSYTIACLSKDKDKYLEVGKVATGIKEKEEQGVTFAKMTRLLKPLITKTHGREVEVKEKIVIEVAYEEIQASPNYKSGYALRFPRFVRLRTDERSAKDINTIEDIKRIYKKQRGQKK